MVSSHRACGFAAGAALLPVYRSDCLSSIPLATLETSWCPVGTLSAPVDSQVPRHVGIIMDGNGRWARRRGRPASFGHRAGVRAIKRALQACEDLGVHTLSIYAFSTENWARPRAEVRALMRLFHETMQREIDEM